MYPVTTSLSPSPASVVRFVSSGVVPSVAVSGGGDKGRTAVAFQPLLNDAMAAANPKMETHIYITMEYISMAAWRYYCNSSRRF